MMQLIHDVAPKANQAFHTAFHGQADFAQGIVDLKNAASNNWYNPQTVTVTAEDDSVYEGDHTGTIINTASSTDPSYDNYELPSVTANIADNDPTP